MFNLAQNSTIIKYNDLSTPGPDHIFWKCFKAISKDKRCLINIVNIANVCINIVHWLSHFKISLYIIIPKHNKVTYDSLKAFCPIVLPNTLEKLIEKVISKRLQFQSISNNFIHPNQLGGLKQHLTIDTGIFLTHLIHLR